MQVWDALLIVDDLIEFIPYVCIAILYVNREELLAKTQVSDIMIKLQTIGGITNGDKLIKTAFAFYGEFN